MGRARIAGDTLGDNTTKSKKPRQQGVRTTGADNTDIENSWWGQPARRGTGVDNARRRDGQKERRGEEIEELSGD